jgi:PAS domain S-box-containing protein
VEHHLLESFFLFGGLPANAEKGTYIPLLVFASYAVAAFGSYTGLSVARLILLSQTPIKKYILRWLAAFAYGSGFWAMHFVGMLAYQTQIEVSYDPWITFVSLLISIGIVYLVLKITRVTEMPSHLRIFLGSVLLGFGICAMHYTGMEAMRMNASLRFVPSLFFLSVLIAILASEAALETIFTIARFRGKDSVIGRIIAANILGAGICGAYYMSMAAAVFSPFSDNSWGIDHSSQFLALVILAVTTGLLFILTFAISNRAFLTIGCGALFALPLVIIIHQSISEMNIEVQNLRKEQLGIVYHQELAQLLHRLADIRDLAFVIRRGESGLSGQLVSETGEMKKSLAAVDGFDLASLDNEAIDQDWQSLKSEIAALPGAQSAKTPDEEFKQYSGASQSLVNFMNEVADDANLSAESGTDKDFMFDYSIHIIPQIWQVLSGLRSDAAGMLASGVPLEQWTDEEKFKLKNSLYLLAAYDEELEGRLKMARLSNSKPLHLSDYHDHIVGPLLQILTGSVEQMLSSRGRAMSGAEMFSLATDSLASLDPFYDKPTTAFLDLLKQREKARVFSRNLMFYSSSAAFAGFIALFVFLNRTLLKTERAQKIALQTQEELAVRLAEKERLEKQMQEYTDRLELARFDVMEVNTKLKEEEAKIRAIMDNVLEGIVALDESGAILAFNKAAEHVFGYKSGEVVGQPVSLLVPPEHKSATEARIKRYIETREAGIVGVERETVGQRKDGSLFPAMSVMSEVVLGRARLFIVLVRDITAQKEKEEDLLRLKERAETANKTKSEFLANMSHELRTPLNSVFGMTRLLLGTKLTTEQQDLANLVLLSSNTLMEIVNDILDLSKIEAGEVTLERIGFDPRQVLHSVVRALAHAAREKHVPIVRLYENETLPYLIGDPLRVGRIVTNLLSNAIKYTDVGHIEVRAHTKKLDETHVDLCCEVTDTGIGIPENKLESVFDKFVQADNSTTRKYGGTGLGLAITRELILLMGGKIGASSQVGSGSTFWFAIPFEVTDKLHEEKHIRRQKTLLGIVPPKDAHILVAEDHPLNQLLIKRLLDKFGIGAVEIVPNGNEVLKAYENGLWTAILMDCHMPEKNGYDATIAIREREKINKRHVPIIAMTANAMVGDKEKCLHSGMDEYVSKPINVEELKEVLSQWIAFNDESSKDKSGESMTQETPPVDLTMLRTLTGGDTEVEKELMKTFVDQSDKNLETLTEYGPSEGDCKPWMEAAHMLKGGSGSIGAEALRQLCSEAQLYKGDSVGRLLLLEKISEEYLRVKEHLKKEGLLS